MLINGALHHMCPCGNGINCDMAKSRSISFIINRSPGMNWRYIFPKKLLLSIQVINRCIDFLPELKKEIIKKMINVVSWNSLINKDYVPKSGRGRGQTLHETQEILNKNVRRVLVISDSHLHNTNNYPDQEILKAVRNFKNDNIVVLFDVRK